MVQHKIEVSNKEEGKAVEKAMSNPVTRAIVVVEGVLADLDQAQQKRVLQFVQESLGVITGD